MTQWFIALEDALGRIPEPIGTLVNYILVFLLLAFLFVLPLVTFTVLIERKVLGFMQHRYGPNRVGPRGWLQTIADAIKLIQKEDITPKNADPIPFWFAPLICFIPVFVSFAVVGMGGYWGEGFREVGNEVLRDFKVWAPADLNTGVVLVLAMSSITAIGVFMAGWASNNKYSIFGSMRGVAQVVSYEVPMVLSLLAVVVMTGSLSLKDVALKQGPRWRPLARDYAIDVAYVGYRSDVTQTSIDARLAEVREGFASDAASSLGVPPPTEWTEQNAPLSQVMKRNGLTIVRIGANRDTVGQLDPVALAQPDRDPIALELLAAAALPEGWDPDRVRISYEQRSPIRWIMVTGGIPFLIPMLIGFVVFFITATAETNRSPFDLPEAESELVSGFHTEYTGMKFALFFLGEYAAMILMASIATLCFLGAWWVPWFMTPLAEQWPVIYFFSFFLKMYFLIYVMIWFRATFPRLRPDQLMDYAWKTLLPLSMVNLLIVAYFQFSDWDFTTLRQTNYQLWYNNAIAGLDWPVWRCLLAMLMLPLIPDMFGNHYPRVAKYLTPFLWIFSIAFVFDGLILNYIWRGNVIPHVIIMDAAWIASIWFLGKALLTLADGLPEQKYFRLSHLVLMAIVPIASICGLTERAQPEISQVFAWIQALMWWFVTVPIALGLLSLSQRRAPEKRTAILANKLVSYKPVSLNLGDVKAEIVQSTELTPFYNRSRPASMATPASASDVPDWRDARFPEEKVPAQPAQIPGQQGWGDVKPLPGMNTR